MAKAIDVARYLIELAAAEDEPDYLSHLRLQKLLYYAQAWSLVMREAPIFPERIKAWAHGPVVPEVYSAFSHHGFGSIPPEAIGAGGVDELTAEERVFLDGVWESYKGYSATSLRNMTQQESPWIDARKGCGPADNCDAEITHEAMRQYFAQHVA